MNCPVCGWTEENYKPLSIDQLRKKRLLNIFGINLSNTWWITQPKWICNKLYESGVKPSSILDVGCGDGRWIPGIREVYGNIKYLGIDRIAEHIAINKENMPEEIWIHGDVVTNNWLNNKFDTIILGGVLNPGLAESTLEYMFNAMLSLNPIYFIILYDLNSTGIPEFDYIGHAYNPILTIMMPKDEQGPRQNNQLRVYERA